MKHMRLAGSTAVIALLAGTAAQADVTPEDVWQSWQSMAQSLGQTMESSSAARDGDVLVVKGLQISYAKDGFETKTRIDEVNFKDKGDGTVEITLSESFPVEMTVPASKDMPDSGPTNVTLEFALPGETVQVSGTPDAMKYAYDVPNGTVKLKAIEGKDATANDLTVEATMTGLKGNYATNGPATARKFDSDFTLAGLALAVVAEDSAQKLSMNVTANVADLAGNSASTLAGMDATNDLAAALKAGFALKGGFSHGALDFNLDVTEDGKPTSVKGSSAKGDLVVEMDGNRLHYQGSSGAVGISVTSADIPFPEVKLNYDETAFNLDMPITKSDTPADFAFLTRIVGLKVSDELWGMFDPTATLPRDPATLIIDTKGTARLTTDIFNEAEMAALGDAPPAELDSITLNELKVTAVGADLAGSGALTFDNTDMTTFAGAPAPTGTLDFKLLGANALLDKLKTMGLVSDDQLMGARMMMGMFANATGDDELSSKVEFKDKHLFVNGQQMQ